MLNVIAREQVNNYGRLSRLHQKQVGGVFVSALQRSRINRTHTHAHTRTHTCDEELAHILMEADKSHELPSTSWRTQDSWWCSLAGVQMPEDRAGVEGGDAEGISLSLSSAAERVREKGE